MMGVSARLSETTLLRGCHRPAPGPRGRGSKGLRVSQPLIANSSPAIRALQRVSSESAKRNRGVTEPARFRVEARARDEKVFQPRRDPFFAATQCRAQEDTKAPSAAVRQRVAALTSLRRTCWLASPR